MRTGFALISYRHAPFLLQTPIDTSGEIIRSLARPILAFAAGIFLAAALAAQAQESIEPDVLPSLAEPPSSSVESLPSTPAEPLAASSQSSPSIAPEPLPSSEAAVPSSEQAFPSSADPWSSSTNYTAAQTNTIPPPSAAGPYGALDSKNVFAGEASSGEPRRFHYRLQLTVRGVWDDNIFISHTNRVSDYYFAIEPQITIGFGDIEGRSSTYLRLDYMPSAILFVDHSDEDAFNQLIHLEGGYNSGRLRLSLSEDIALLESANLNSISDTTGLWANLDASGPTRVNIFNTRLRADYDLTGKVFLQGEFDSSIFFYPNHISSYTISGGLYVYYNWLPKLSVGIGGTFGYDWVDDPTPNQTFGQVNARLNYQATSKFNLYASAGVEFRQFDNDQGDHTTPVFEVGATYHPFDGTNLTLAAGRRIYNSGFLADQDFADTYVVARFQQRLFRRVYLGLASGYENSDYFAAREGVSAPRNDDYWFIEPSVDVLITRWLSAGAYYLHRDDSSSIDFFSFYDNQVGVRATVRF